MGIRLKLAVFIAEVALFGGHYANWIHQRHEFLARNTARTEEYDDWQTSKKHFGCYQITGWDGHYFRKTKRDSFSFLWLFGEERQGTIVLVFRVDKVPEGSYGKTSYSLDDNEKMLKVLPEDQMKLAERLFPEASFRFRIYDVEEIQVQ
jgi:hypothetical protein